MKLDFTIDWGYQYLYSRRHYHPFFEWDGHLEVSEGKILRCAQLEYPVIWFGPGECPKEHELERPAWRSRTRRGVAGIRVLADVPETARFKLVTLSGEFLFSAADILEKGRIVFPVGPKYLNCSVIVTRRGYLWFRPAPQTGDTVYEARDLALEQHDWARMETAWLAPGKTVEFPLTVAETTHDFQETLLHLEVMAASPAGFTPEKESHYHADYLFRFYCDGKLLAEKSQYLREHDNCMQMLEDVWVHLPIPPGKHTIGVENGHASAWLLFSRVVMKQLVRDHLQFCLPEWALTHEEVTGKIFAVRPDRVTIRWEEKSLEMELKPGWNSFLFSVDRAGRRIPIAAGNSRAAVETVYDLEEEAIPVKVGYDMTVVPHDKNGFMDWLLDYTDASRLGNFVVFRSFHLADGSFAHLDIPGPWMREWGNFCRTHHLTVEAATDFIDGELVRGAGEMMHSVGLHEYPGAVYAFDPQKPYLSNDMKEASEKFMAYLKLKIDEAHASGARAAFGDASGGHRYCYLAGVDFLRTETMVPHTMHLCSQARPAAEALASGEWGVHIAMQHPMQPYFENHLGLYYLSLMQPWMMGANVLYEEDSIFLMFKEERQAWDDALTKGKRDMTREFFRFAKTHPRKGKCIRKIAFLEGRYAAPFNGFICDVEQDPDYAVWGRFGNPAPEWGHRQPEKCRQLLDVLMPGASTHPLRQDYGKRRFFFSGTPYGDFDEVPVEANESYWEQYQLLLNLGWNTMIPEDYDKHKAFVEHGGTLLTGIPQFSTHVKRDFLRDFEDLALWNSGDLSEFAGIRVKGRGSRFSGQWNCTGRTAWPDPELSAVPSVSAEEDGEGFAAKIELAGAEVVVWDAGTAEPLLVRFKLGKGYVYTLTFWAYPGHEKFQRFSAGVIAMLAEKTKGDLFVEDPSREIFWTRWSHPASGANDLLMLLNTDWSTPGNEKTVTIHAGTMRCPVRIRERECLFFHRFANGTVLHDARLHLEEKDSVLWAYGIGKARFVFFEENNGGKTVHLSFEQSTEQQVGTLSARGTEGKNNRSLNLLTKE